MRLHLHWGLQLTETLYENSIYALPFQIADNHFVNCSSIRISLHPVPLFYVFILITSRQITSHRDHTDA